jgi:ABC-type phosphate transport system ATPase subunit
MERICDDASAENTLWQPMLAPCTHAEVTDSGGNEQMLCLARNNKQGRPGLTGSGITGE